MPAAMALLIVAVACGGGASATAKSPQARGYHHMFSTTEGVLLYGGETAPPPGGGNLLGDVWIYRKGTGWTARSSIGQKDGITGYDTKSARMVAFVDSQGKFDPLNENWVYDPAADSWQQLPLGIRPEPLSGGEMAYDAESDRLILFSRGGDTWAYDLDTNTWKLMSPKTSPSARDWGAIDYDPKSDRIILFGGGINDQGQSDLWTYDYNNNSWRELHPATTPPGRMYPAMTYDPTTSRMIVFGGLPQWSGQALGDTWAYDSQKDTWTNLTPAKSPGARARHAMAYDSETRTIVLFGGGADPFAFKADTWIYDPVRNTWTKV
jgi:Galactose oxidase, central domain